MEVYSDKDVGIQRDTEGYKQVLGALHVQVTTSVPYTYTSNPLCKRQNQEVEYNLRALMKQQSTKHRIRLLPWAVLTMNSQRSSGTACTPTNCLMGGVWRGFSKPPSMRTVSTLLGIG